MSSPFQQRVDDLFSNDLQLDLFQAIIDSDEHHQPLTELTEQFPEHNAYAVSRALSRLSKGGVLESQVTKQGDRLQLRYSVRDDLDPNHLAPYLDSSQLNELTSEDLCPVCHSAFHLQIGALSGGFEDEEIQRLREEFGRRVHQHEDRIYFHTES